MTKLYHPDPSAACSVERAEDGSFDVPAEEVAELLHHGFVTDPRLAEAGPHAELVKDATAARTEAEHVKAEFAILSEDRDALALRVKALEAEVATLTARAHELEAELATTLAHLEAATAPPAQP